MCGGGGEGRGGRRGRVRREGWGEEVQSVSIACGPNGWPDQTCKSALSGVCVGGGGGRGGGEEGGEYAERGGVRGYKASASLVAPTVGLIKLVRVR